MALSEEVAQARQQELIGLQREYPDCHLVLDPEEYEGGLQRIVFQAEHDFIKFYSSRPTGCAKGSCRVEVLGNFTDQGFGLGALGFPTNLGVAVAVGPRTDRIVNIWSDINPTEEPTLIDLDHLMNVTDTSHWSHYQISILHQLQIYSGVSGINFRFADLHGVNMCFSANVPPGTAISTSAAVEASFIHGFLGGNKMTIPERNIVQLTKTAENSIGSGCGILDQAVSNTPGKGVYLRFVDTVKDGIPYTAEQVSMDLLEKHGVCIVVVFANGVGRRLEKTDYARKARLIKEGSTFVAETLGMDIYTLSISDVTQCYDRLKKEKGDETARAVRHVYSDNERVKEATRLVLSLRDIEPFTSDSHRMLQRLGEIFSESGRSSIKDYEVETGIPEMPTFEPLLEVLTSSPGSLGARNEGGGGIPTCIALIKTKDKDQYMKTIPEKMAELYPSRSFVVVPLEVGKHSRVLTLQSS